MPTMNETLFIAMVIGLLCASVLAGMWWAGVEPIRDLVRGVFAWLRFFLFVAFVLGGASAILYGVVRLIRMAWSA